MRNQRALYAFVGIGYQQLHGWLVLAFSHYAVGYPHDETSGDTCGLESDFQHPGHPPIEIPPFSVSIVSLALERVRRAAEQEVHAAGWLIGKPMQAIRLFDVSRHRSNPIMSAAKSSLKHWATLASVCTPSQLAAFRQKVCPRWSACVGAHC